MISSCHNVYSLDYLSFNDLSQSLDLGEPCLSGSLYVVMAQVLSTISTKQGSCCQDYFNKDIIIKSNQNVQYHVWCALCTLQVVMQFYLLALEMKRCKKLVLILVQYGSLFWKLPTLDGFTTNVAVAPFLV